MYSVFNGVESLVTRSYLREYEVITSFLSVVVLHGKESAAGAQVVDTPVPRVDGSSWYVLMSQAVASEVVIWARVYV